MLRYANAALFRFCFVDLLHCDIEIPDFVVCGGHILGYHSPIQSDADGRDTGDFLATSEINNCFLVAPALSCHVAKQIAKYAMQFGEVLEITATDIVLYCGEGSLSVPLDALDGRTLASPGKIQT